MDLPTDSSGIQSAGPVLSVLNLQETDNTQILYYCDHHKQRMLLRPHWMHPVSDPLAKHILLNLHYTSHEPSYPVFRQSHDLYHLLLVFYHNQGQQNIFLHRCKPAAPRSSIPIRLAIFQGLLPVHHLLFLQTKLCPHQQP